MTSRKFSPFPTPTPSPFAISREREKERERERERTGFAANQIRRNAASPEGK
jgi:hypothetical protein